MRYACIARHRAEFQLGLMCRVLDVSRTGFYAWLQRAPSGRAREDSRLRAEIRAIHTKSKQSYGRVRIRRVLSKQQIAIGCTRVARLMREERLRTKRSPRFHATTQSDHRLPVAPNLLHQEFTVDAPNRVWVSDITYIRTDAGWLYLATVLDLYSRKIVGWSLKRTLHEGICLEALKRAIAIRRPDAGLIHHSDRGKQYAGWAYQDLLRAHQIEPSMSRKGNCWDNAVAESFFALLKVERLHGQIFRTRSEARREVVDFIERWYNRERQHSTLGGISPIEFEAQRHAA